MVWYSQSGAWEDSSRDYFSIWSFLHFLCSFPTYFFKMLFYEKARTCFGGVSFEVCSTHKQAYFMHFQLFLFRECFELILFGRLDRTYTKRLTSWIFRIIFVKLATVWMSRSPPEAAPLRLRLATLDAALRGIDQLSVIWHTLVFSHFCSPGSLRAHAEAMLGFLFFF